MGTVNYQYEPLPVPSGWGREERLFLQRLTDVLDDIYLKWGRISEKELSTALRNTIRGKADAADLEQYSTISQTAQAIAAQVGSIAVGGVNLLQGTAKPLCASAEGDMGGYRGSGDSLPAGEELLLHFDYDIAGGGSASVTAMAGGEVAATFLMTGEEGHVQESCRLVGTDISEMTFRLYAPTGEVTLSRVQLERGNLATDWSQADGELVAGSSVEITKDHVRIGTEAFSVGFGGDEYMALDASGGYFPRLSSPQVLPRYTGPCQLYVSAGEADGESCFASLSDALSALGDRWLEDEVTVYLSGGTEYGEALLRGICGGGKVRIEGGGGILYNGLTVSGCSIPVEISGLKVWHTDVPVRISACSWVLLEGCTFEAMSDTAVVHVDNGSAARLVDTAMAEGNFSLRAFNGSRVSVYNCKGNANLCSQAAFVIGSGTLPSASASSVTTTAYQNGYISVKGTVSQGSGRGAIAAPASGTETGASVYARETAYHQSVWNTGNGYFYQGYASPYGGITGCMWFDLSECSGMTAAGARLRLTRVAGYGQSGSVSVQLMGLDSGCTGSGTPLSRIRNYGVIGTIAPGATKTFTIPAAAAQDLLDGITGGLCLYVPDSAVQSGLSFSVNYARFYGTAGGDDTRPLLTITI